jgi:UDP-N-acetylmuramate dehydrogenase
MKILENVALAPFTTFGIGGPARWFADAVTEGEILEAVQWARQRSLPLFILGGGSNLLIADAGFPGLVLRVSLQGIRRNGDVYRVCAGVNWDEFVQRTVEDGCAGVECLAGIPGTVGGTPVQNVGAYGQEVSETIEIVRALDLQTLEFAVKTPAECGFSYRQSIFNSTEQGRYLVTGVQYRLRTGGEPSLRYADLQRAFPAGIQPMLAEVAAAVRRIRQSKGMLLAEGDADCRSAGSFFKNPVISEDQFRVLAERLGAEPPHYPAGAGQVKLPAAWLIEQAGFPKGFRQGRAGISSRHTLALVNLGGATAAEMLALRDTIAAGVAARHGIPLDMEPVLVGFSSAQSFRA